MLARPLLRHGARDNVVSHNRGEVDVLDRLIVKAVICLTVALASGTARAQEGTHEPPPVEEAGASVELSLSIAPQLVLARLLPGGLGGLGGLSGLGNLGDPSFPVVMDVGLAIDPRAFFVVGVSGGFSEWEGGQSWQLSVPLSVLVYLDAPRVGAVMPTLRVGGVLGWFGSANGGERRELVSGNLLARGGVTWLPTRWLGVRAEIGANVGVLGALSGFDTVSGSLGFEASLALVLRV